MRHTARVHTARATHAHLWVLPEGPQHAHQLVALNQAVTGRAGAAAGRLHDEA